MLKLGSRNLASARRGQGLHLSEPLLGGSNVKNLIEQTKTRAGKAGYLLLWLLGVPLPILFLIFLLRGCN